MKTVIYYNPRCSKSRQALKLLQENGIEPVIIDYLQTPPDVARLETLCDLLGKNPAEIIRFKESVAREKQLTARDQRTAQEWLQLITENPVLLERPIVVVDDKKAVLGRPPEQVLSIL